MNSFEMEMRKKFNSGHDSIKITCKIRKNSNESSRMLREYSSIKQDWYFETKEQS